MFERESTFCIKSIESVILVVATSLTVGVDQCRITRTFGKQMLAQGLSLSSQAVVK